MKDFFQYILYLFGFDADHPLLFTQFHFWAFFFLVYIGFTLIVEYGRPSKQKMGKKRRLLRNGYLALISLLFYYKTSGLFVLLLIFSTILGYVLGVRMDHLVITPSTKNKRHAKWLMFLGVALNLTVLGYFKYAYFFTDIHNTIFTSQYEVVNIFAQWSNWVTSTSHFDASVILLPVGISFFTFQNISYIVDVYKGKVKHCGNIIDFGFYTTFFPQLVAGPIVRADQFVPQLYKPFHLTKRQFGIALFWILNGLLKKIVLSDFLATSFCDRVFTKPDLYTGFENFSALIIYSLQVYADFSGYTDIAIGVAMLMGFYLPKNFDSPYKATNCAGFWKRWHISLSNWLKDYLYIPLGGNRNGTAMSYIIIAFFLLIVALMAKTAWVWLTVSIIASLLIAIYILFPKHRKTFATNINNMDTMLLGGLWHGASFNFITWGGLNGLGILVYKMWKPLGSIARILVVAVVFGLCYGANCLWPCPLLSMLSFLSAICCIAITLLNLWAYIKNLAPGSKEGAYGKVLMVWNTLLTFVFISFTRLFFRSGSNLNPAEANEVAWETAKAMVNRIGGKWDLSQIGPIMENYYRVFIVFVIGMIIHWLPERFKRRYRLWFASLPLWAMLLIAVAAVFVAYQFITADLQPFIYFQF